MGYSNEVGAIYTDRPRILFRFPEGPSIQYLRFLVPKTILLMVFGPSVLKYWLLGPSGLHTVVWKRPKLPGTGWAPQNVNRPVRYQTDKAVKPEALHVAQKVQVPKYLRTLGPNTMKSMVLGTRNLKYWVLGPSGYMTFHGF